jgi:tetratricopeptide (TPR) repeat protein
MRYKGTGKSIEAIGRELGVSHVLEGTVRRTDARVRVTVQLVRVNDQTHLWVDDFERPPGDLLELHDDIARAVAARIGVQLTPRDQTSIAAARPVREAAYEAYLRGRYFWKRRSAGALRKSEECFREAIRIDAEYASAYAALADVHLTRLDYNDLSPQDAFVLAERALLEALRLDATSAEPHTSLGHLRLHQFDWANAERQFTRAIALDARYETAHYYYANLLAVFGRFDEAIAEATRALEFDPMSVNARQNRLFILMLARRYDAAIEEGARIIDMDPAYTALYYDLGRVYQCQGDDARAMAAFEQVRAVSEERRTPALAGMAYVHARAGRREKALDLLRQLEAQSARTYVSSYDLALLHLALGDTAQAFAQLSKACDEYSSHLPFVNVDARLDGVRADPRYHSLVERLNLHRTALPDR